MAKLMTSISFRSKKSIKQFTYTVVHIDTIVTIQDPISGQAKDVALDGQYENWTLMAILKINCGVQVAVFEDLSEHGMIVYVSCKGIELQMIKRLESTYAYESSCYLGHKKERVTQSYDDILGKEILAAGEDPDFVKIASCFPPIRDSRYGTEEGVHTFVGTKESVDIVPIYYTADKGIWRVNPLYISKEMKDAIENKTICEGLVGGWLPVVRMVYPVAENIWWESITFAKTDIPNPYIQPTWYRYTKIDHGKVADIHYIDSYIPYPIDNKPDPVNFYRDLYRLNHYWNEQFNYGMSLDLPEDWLSDFCKHSFVMEMISRIDDHPRYGVVNKLYGGPEHDGFMDILTGSVDCYLEWGMCHIAKRYLDYYFTHFVRPNGLVEYRGPEIGQYARILACFAQYYDYTKDSDFLLKYDGKLNAIVGILIERRRAAKLKAKEDATYGLIAGRHEADIGFLQTEITSQDFEVPYYSNSTQAWRGLRDIGRAWSEIGQKDNIVELTKRGEKLLQEACELKEDICRSMDASVLCDRDMPFLPPIAGCKEYYYDMPYRHCPVSYDDNRVWCEMMHSGMVPSDKLDMIMRHSREHQTMRMGIFGNRWSIIAFLCHGEAYSLIQHDRIHEFLLLYYSHILHAHTRGSWTVSECVDMDRDRGNHAPFCAPAQMVVPIITKWMLVFEDPLTEQIWLGKAIPRIWLDDGKKVSIHNSPIRKGLVSYEICSNISNRKVTASIEVFGGALFILRLRTPSPFKIKSVYMNGSSWSDFDVENETISLPPNTSGIILVEVYY